MVEEEEEGRGPKVVDVDMDKGLQEGAVEEPEREPRDVETWRYYQCRH